MIQTVCKSCGNKKDFNDDKLGKKFKCPKCSNIILIEKTESTSPPESKIVQAEEQKTNPSPEKVITNSKNSKAKYILICTLVLVCIGFFAVKNYLDNKQEAERQKEIQEKVTQDSLAAINAAIQQAAEQAAADSVAQAAQKQTCLFNQLSRLFDYGLSIVSTTDNANTFWELTVIDKANNTPIKTLSIQINGMNTSLDCNARSYITGFNKDVVAGDGDYGSLVIEDFNFDGLEDIAVRSEMNNSGAHYSFFLQTLSHDYISDSFLTDTISRIPQLNIESKTLNEVHVVGVNYISERNYRYDSTGVWIVVSDTLKEIGR